ncbi:hypothetical protein GCM10009681_05630 [Luedemannella helvata]|uniref:Uncharacterized protein n=1 Tax=Luedemannella helvata TaxID=349315 RepID=A0ABP4VTS3_9ACTN
MRRDRSAYGVPRFPRPGVASVAERGVGITDVVKLGSLLRLRGWNVSIPDTGVAGLKPRGVGGDRWVDRG